MTDLLNSSMLVLRLMCFQPSSEPNAPPVVSLNESVVDVQFESSDSRVVAQYITTDGQIKLYTLSGAEICLVK